MNVERRAPWWAPFGTTPAVPDDAPDPADLGTAFGLDASLAETRVPAKAKGRTADAAPLGQPGGDAARRR